MPLAPETATSPLAQAPPDRPTSNLEQALRQVTAIIFADRKMDLDEQHVFRGFMEEVAMRAQNGGIGQGGTPSAGPQETGMPPTPYEMNQNTEDLGSVEGAVPEEEY